MSTENTDRKRIIVVGQNPGTYKRRVPKHTSLTRLNEWMDRVGVRGCYSFVNCHSSPKSSLRLADVDQSAIEHARSYDRVIALGEFANEALKRASIPHFKLPHPSGLNRRINDQKFMSMVFRNCREYLRDE